MKEKNETTNSIYEKVDEVRSEMKRAIFLMKKINDDLESLSRKLDVLTDECERVIRERSHEE
ncbi:hypothetical protein [Paenibacillus sp. 1001270B_150601_E10]|uniref:hypothetical protein n=1 Tax=Paenibacillus sp. 1001270B_150601_E10 TaxID=2787079 RepID=UPI00189E68D4|nr:hypothetical protein [Paenibacillus sp. 1001270B_150601_E10]